MGQETSTVLDSLFLPLLMILGLSWSVCFPAHSYAGLSSGMRTTLYHSADGLVCGACHGKVAFPINACERCHSKPVR